MRLGMKVLALVLLTLAATAILPIAVLAQEEERKPLFVGAWPYLLPPQGHFNTFVTNALTFGIYHQVIQEPLALYVWANQSYIPWLATSWELSGDYFVVNLREGVTFHDGTEFTAKDVACTFLIHYMLNHPMYKYMDDVEIVNDHTVRFHITKPSPVIIRYILREPIRPYSTYKEYCDKVAELKAQGKGPTSDEMKALAAEFREFRPEEYVGTGPFMWTGEITESEVWFKFYEDYWNKERVKFRWLKLINGETPQVTPHVLAKEVDYATHGFPPATEKQFVEEGIRIIRAPIYSGPALYFNHRIWPLSEKKFRQAIAYAINKTENGWVSLMQSGKRVELMSGLPREFEEAWLYPETRAKLNTYEYDPEKAAELLEELGFRREGGVWVYPNGTPLEFELSFPAEYADWSAAAQNVAEQLTAFGIKIVPRAVTFTIHPTEVHEGKFQLAIRHWGGGANPHPYFHFYAVFIFWNEREAGIGEGRPGISFSLVRDTECCGRVDIKELVFKCPEGFDVEKQKEIVNKLALIYNEELPGIMLWERYGNNPVPEGVRTEGWPPDDDPIYQNPPYGDAFTVLMLLTGYGIKPTPENMPARAPAGPNYVIIAGIAAAVVVAAAAAFVLARRRRR